MDFEEQKRGLLFALTNTLRTSRLVDMVNGQEAAAAFAMSLSRAQPGAPIDLEPFYKWLVDEKKLPKDVVAETLVFLKSREGRYQVNLVLPKEALATDEASRQRIVQEFVQRGASTSGIYQGLQPGQAPKEVSGKKTAAPGPSGMSGSSRAAPGPSSRKRPPVGLIALLAVVALLGVAVTLYVQDSAPLAPRSFTITDEQALRCEQLTANHGYALCRMKKADIAKLDAAELDRAGKATRAAASRAGHTRGLHLYTIEDNKRVRSW